MRWWNLQQLKSNDARTRRQAVEKLAANDDERSAVQLTTALRDADAGVRAAAVRGLGQLRAGKLEELILPQMRDADPAVREATVEALVVTLKDEQDSVRALATTALRRLDRNWEKSDAAKRAIPELRAGLKHKEYWVRQAAADALAKIGEMRQAAAEALGRLGDQQAVPPLAGALRDASRWVGRSAARSLRALQWLPRTDEERL